jgi:hypothetical protein
MVLNKFASRILIIMFETVCYNVLFESFSQKLFFLFFKPLRWSKFPEQIIGNDNNKQEKAYGFFFFEIVRDEPQTIK